MMTAREPDRIVWHTSSYSVGNGDCVQVAPAPGAVLVRDSKDPTTRPDRPHPRLASLPHHARFLSPGRGLIAVCVPLAT